jgi:hypothetical protein
MAVTVAEWVATRRPAPPATLLARTQEVLGEAGARPASEAHDACLGAGERLLASLIEREATTRAAALDLLVADALVSWAFEAAADEPASLDARAGDALARLSRLGAA